MMAGWFDDVYSSYRIMRYAGVTPIDIYRVYTFYGQKERANAGLAY